MLESSDRLGVRPMDGVSHQDVIRELVLMHAAVLQRMPFVQAAMALGVVTVVYGKVPTAMILAWCALTIGMEAVRAVYATWLLADRTRIQPSREHARMTLLAALCGGTVALIAVIFFPHLDVLDQAVLGVAMYAIPAAGVAVSMSSRYIIAAYSFMILIPASITWVVLHPQHLIFAMSSALLVGTMLTVVAAEGEKLLQRSLQIQRERDRVVRDLERSNADVHAAMVRAEQSSQARARVLASASHDLRQPLHALSIYSAVLAEKPTADTLREVGQNIHQIVRSLGILLTGLLDLSKLSVGYYVVDRQVFALDRLVDELFAEFREPAKLRGLLFTQVLRPVWVNADANAVARIARNLIDNAIKYTEAGSVQVSVAQIDDTAVLVIADTGKGIALDEQARIFEEFYQVDNPGRDRNKGVGLGLAIVQRLCDLIGCRIALESAPGHGARFTVTVAAAVPAPIVAQAPAMTTTGGALDGHRIYVIDDEVAILNSMSMLLGVWGAQVECAEGPESALLLCKRLGVPDLMITDLRLGGDEHGAALATRLRAQFGHFPVLIITGETSSDGLRTANEAGFPLLQKPISNDRLRQAIGVLIAPPIPSF